MSWLKIYSFSSKEFFSWETMFDVFVAKKSY
jgi:hypothetical protein